MDINALGSSAPIMPKSGTKEQASVLPAPQPLAGPVAAANVVTQMTAPKPSKDKLEQAVKDINSSLQALSRGIEFSVDEASKMPLVKVIDLETKVVIRQMPSEQALQIAKVLDQVLGKLLSEKA